MYRFAVLLAGCAFAAACGTTDDRPATLEVVSLTVLAPSCGMVACHSTTTKTEGYAFDTLTSARESLRGLVSPGDPSRSHLIEVLRSREMPPDSPMADQDVALVEAWIAGGAEGL
jgi:hypothetical protein